VIDIIVIIELPLNNQRLLDLRQIQHIWTALLYQARRPNNVCIHEGDEWKAAFCINRGLFEPLVMYFGLTNSPATFQTMMNEIFQDLITKGVISVYLNDILIFTNSLEDHCWITCLVLDRMCEHKLYLRPEKYKFEKTKNEYLGVIISHNKVEMDPVKIAGVADWPTPSKRGAILHWLRQLLLMIHPGLLSPCMCTL
jgi:hypothetical protein